MRAPYMAAVMSEEQVLEEWEVVRVVERVEVILPHSTISIKHIRAWSRMVRGILTISNLKRFWGHLGHYLKEVKRRGLGN